ncbi:MAG TPA: DUF5668 domain-containing protein [Bryobacteraceae bacterium]|nr:DUF5668 domain-containing protein [Bryobacteraceae bacterium]
MTSSGSFISAIRGPVMMITLGVLVTIDHFGSVSFWRTWPVLLIVIGLLKLAERFGAKSV